MKSSCVKFIVCMMMSLSAIAADWNVASGSFTNADNWLPSGVPGIGGTALIANSGTASFDGGAATNLTAINIGTGSAAARGTLEQSAGTLSTTLMPIGKNGGTGTFRMSGGTLDVFGGAGALSVAPFNGSTGTVVMTGGTLTTANELWIGPNAGGVASFYLNGGTVICKSWGVVGRGSTNAKLYINGGSWSNVVANNFTIGSGGSGSVIMSNGTLYALNTLYVAELVPGTLDVYNGTVAANNLIVSGNSTAAGRLTVEGGSFWLNAMTRNGAVSSVNFSGGTLGTRDGNATWSAPVNVTNTGIGYLTLYGANQAGASRVNVFSGAISGNGGIVVDSFSGQTGTVVFSANNTYSGGTTLKGTNTLQLGNAGTAGWLAGSLAIENGGNLAFARTDTITNTIAITGTGGAIIQNGTGTLVLTNKAPTFTSAVANTGLLRITDSAAIPGAGASVTINAGGTLLMDGAYPSVADWLNSGRIVNTSSGALALLGNSAETIDLTSAGSGLYSNIWLGTTGNYTYSGNITPINNTFKFGGGGGTLTVSTPLSGSGTTFDTRGTVSLTGNNSGLTGGVTVKGTGTLIASNANAVGSENVLVQNGSILQVAAPITLSGGIRVDNFGMVKVVQGGSITGVVTNNSIWGVGAMPQGGLLFSGSGTLTHSSNVEGSGAMAVNSGTLSLNTPAQTITQAELWVGNNGGAGNLDMSAGTLNATNWLLVARGTEAATPLSTFTLRGGTLNKTGANPTIIGDIRGSVGVMVMSNNATFNATGDIIVSTGDGKGTLSVYGGLLNQTTGNFVLNNNYNNTAAGSSSTVNLYGGVISNSAGSVVIGNGAAGRGTLTITNGLLYARNTVYVGNAAGAVATLNVTNGTLTVGNIVVGNVANATGTVNQINGTIARAPTGGGDWQIGSPANSVGTYTLQGGTLDTGAANFQVGTSGRGTLNQTGGTLTSGQWPVVGRAGGGTGFYTLSGGTFNQTGAGNRLIVGEQGTGTFTVSGTGVANLTGGLRICMDYGGYPGTGTVNLVTGGTIVTPLVETTGGKSTLNFDGGTLRARNSGATIANFLQGLTLASVKAGGAVIDSSNNTVTVAQSLASGTSPDGGLVKLGTGTLILSGTNTYNGTTTVSNGTLRLGVANAITNTGALLVAGGTLDLNGFSVTNGAVTLESGSIINGTLNATSYNLLGSGSIYAKLEGAAALNKTGSGSASLFRANTYTGVTRIEAGTLKLNTLSAELAHRWSFNGDMNDSIGGRTAVRYGTTTPTLSTTQVTLAGGGKGISWIDLGATILPTNNAPLTIELWATQNALQNWSRIFDFGNGTGNYILMSWTRGTDLNMDRVEVMAPGVGTTADSTMKPYTLGVQYHISLVITPGAGTGGNTLVQWYKMDAVGATINTGSFSTTWTLAQLVQNNMWLGHSQYGDNDASASYNEVRIWKAALTQAQLADNSLLGPDLLPMANNALPLGSQVELVASGTFDLGGSTQNLARLSGSGLVTNGQALVSGDVTPGGIGSLNTLTIAGSPVLTGTLRIDVATDGTSDLLNVQGSLNLTNLALQIENPSSLRGSKIYTLAKFTPGQLTGNFKSTNLSGTGWGVVYKNTTGEIRLIQTGTLIMFK